VVRKKKYFASKKNRVSIELEKLNQYDYLQNLSSTHYSFSSFNYSVKNKKKSVKKKLNVSKISKINLS